MQKVSKLAFIGEQISAYPAEERGNLRRIATAALRHMPHHFSPRQQKLATKRLTVALTAQKTCAHQGIGTRLKHVTSLPSVEKPTDKALHSIEHKETNIDPQERYAVEENFERIADLKETAKPAWADGLFPGEDWKLMLSLEQLAQGYVYHDPQDTVKIATKDGLKEYSIEKIPLNRGLVAFGLKCVDGSQPSILLFRGTSFYLAGRAMGDTLIADLDPSGIGHTAYAQGHAHVAEWLAKQPAGTIATGHSLGAALATEAFAANPDKIGKAFTFGSVKVSAETADKINQSSRKNNCVRFFSEDDKLADFGQSGAGREIKCTAEPDVLDAIPHLEKYNAWRMKSFEHRRYFLTMPGVMQEVVTRDKASAYALKGMLLAMARALVTFTVDFKRFFVGAREMPSGMRQLFTKAQK